MRFSGAGGSVEGAAPGRGCVAADRDNNGVGESPRTAGASRAAFVGTFPCPGKAGRAAGERLPYAAAAGNCGINLLISWVKSATLAKGAKNALPPVRGGNVWPGPCGNALISPAGVCAVRVRKALAQALPVELCTSRREAAERPLPFTCVNRLQR